MARRFLLTLLALAMGAAATTPLTPASQMVLPTTDWAATIEGAAVEKHGAAAAASTMALGDLLEPMHGALAGRWAFPQVVLRNAAGDAVSADYDLGAAEKTVAEFLDFVAAEKVSAVLQFEKLEAGPARTFYDDALLGGAWHKEACPGCSAHLYVSPPDQAALANHTDVTDVKVWQLYGEKDWLTCAPKFGDATTHALPAKFTSKLATCSSYGADEMRDAMRNSDLTDETGDFDESLFDCQEASLAAGEGLFVPLKTVHSARARRDGFSAHLTLGGRAAGGEACHAAEAPVTSFEVDVLGVERRLDGEGRRLACDYSWPSPSPPRSSGSSSAAAASSCSCRRSNAPPRGRPSTSKSPRARPRSRCRSARPATSSTSSTSPTPWAPRPAPRPAWRSPTTATSSESPLGPPFPIRPAPPRPPARASLPPGRPPAHLNVALYQKGGPRLRKGRLGATKHGAAASAASLLTCASVKRTRWSRSSGAHAQRAAGGAAGGGAAPRFLRPRLGRASASSGASVWSAWRRQR